jgi:hypothetical protein
MANGKIERGEAIRIATEFARVEWGGGPSAFGCTKRDGCYWVKIRLVRSESKREADWIVDASGRVTPNVVLRSEPQRDVTRYEKYIIQVAVDTGAVEGSEEIETEGGSEPIVHVVVEDPEKPYEVDSSLEELERQAKKYGMDVDRYKL